MCVCCSDLCAGLIGGLGVTPSGNIGQDGAIFESVSIIIIIIMYIYHALINALSTHMMHINLNVIFCTHVKHSPTKTIYIKYDNGE